MLDLTDCTLVCADTRNHALALRALRACRAEIRFARCLLFTDRGIDEPGIELVPIARLGSAADYSRLMIKDLARHIDTEFALVVQWDGYVLHPSAWDDEFRRYDYLGARWPWEAPQANVGNGGFSLRSRRLLAALADPDISDFPVEDIAIGKTYRSLLETRHGIRFPPGEIADRFSFETVAPPRPTFGFHGLYNFWLTLPEAALHEVLAQLHGANLVAPQLRVLGVNYLCAGRQQEAAAVFRCILAALPGEGELLKLLGHAERRRTGPLAGRNDPCPCGSGRRFKDCHGALSAAQAQVALARPTTNAAPLPDLREALRLHEAGEVEPATRIYRALLAIKPDNPIPMHFLGVAALQQKDLEAAIPLLARAASLLPGEPNFHNNLGLALVEAGRVSEALDCYQRALAADPGNVAAWSNLGLARQALLDVAGAIEAFETALRCQPDFDRAHWNLAYAYLLAGRFMEGWREYEWRLRIKDLAGGLPPVPGPQWRGGPLAGKRLLVHAEQGLGDTLQFARFLPGLTGPEGELTLECPDALHGVLDGLGSGVRLHAAGTQRPAYDFHLPLPSLPGLLGVGSRLPISGKPYLRANPEVVAAWRERFRALGGRVVVGLTWGGNPANPYDRHRSCPLAALEPLARVPGVTLVSLQTGERRAELSDLPQDLRPIDCATDLTATAAQIQALDLVISVDTAIAHLAGALGQRTWILLPFSPDWRWLAQGDESAWYASARLFRQKQAGDWLHPVSEVAAALERLADLR